MDECQTWKDKAAALASYAKQAGDETLHRYADRIKALAVRRTGELAKQIPSSQFRLQQNGFTAGTIICWYRTERYLAAREAVQPQSICGLGLRQMRFLS
jgi:hypothetical protein